MKEYWNGIAEDVQKTWPVLALIATSIIYMICK